MFTTGVFISSFSGFSRSPQSLTKNFLNKHFSDFIYISFFSLSKDKLHTTAVNHQQHQSANSCSSTVRSGPSHSKAISQGHLPTQATSLCANQGLTATQLTHFKPGAFITKGVGRKLTVQSTSMPVNFPLGLGNLTSPQQQSARSQHTLLLTATPEDAVGGGVVTGGTKTEIHLQQQISSSPSGLMS